MEGRGIEVDLYTALSTAPAHTARDTKRVLTAVYLYTLRDLTQPRIISTANRPSFYKCFLPVCGVSSLDSAGRRSAFQRKRRVVDKALVHSRLRPRPVLPPGGSV